MSLTDLPGDARLIDLVPLEYDNLSEPTPWINHAESLLGISISFLILSWLFVSFRLFVRWRIVKALGWDDLFVFLYLIFGTIGTVAFLISIRVGTGQHFFFLMIKDIRRYLILFYVMNNSINYAFFFTKLSLLFQYLRIFKDDLLLRRIVYWTMGLVVLWAVAFGALAMIPCWPIDSVWNNPMLGKCWAYGSYDENKFVSTFVSFTVVNMVLDMVVLAIPARLWFTRKMTLKMRVGLVALMFMGVTINFLGAWRLATIIKTKAGRYPTFDPTWYTPTSLILGVLEVHVSSICASVPIFWPVIAPYFGAIFVTQEISVREEYRDTEGARDFAVDDEDDVKRPNSSVGSETELREIDRNRRPSARHYQDEFIMRQVDPLREGQVLSSVQGGAVSEKKRKWQRV